MKSLEPFFGPAAPALVMAALVGACTPTLNWRELSVGAGAKVSLPCRPQNETRTLVLAVPVQLRACEAGQVLWAVTSAQLTSDAQAAEALLEMRRSLVARMAGQASEVPGTARVHIVGRREDGSTVWARAAFLSSGREVYQLVMLPQPGAPSPNEEAQGHFFDGLRAVPVKKLP
jgi:hypothetical protein